MSIDTLVTAPTRLPRVNLMPQEITEANKQRRVHVALACAVAATMVGVGALYVGANGQVSAAQAELDDAQAETTGLQTRVDELTRTMSFKDDVQAYQGLSDAATAREIEPAAYLASLAQVIPSSIWVDKMAFKMNDATRPEEGVATWTFAGAGRKHTDVASFLVALEKVEGLQMSYVTKSVKVTPPPAPPVPALGPGAAAPTPPAAPVMPEHVRFDVTVRFNEQALARRAEQIRTGG